VPRPARRIGARRRPAVRAPLAAAVVLAQAAAVLAAAPPFAAPLAAAPQEPAPPAAAEPAPPAAADPGTDPAAALALARERLAADDPEGAIAALEPAAAAPEAPPPVVSFLAGLYVDQGRAEEALALLAPRLAGADDPSEAVLLFVAARAAQALGESEEAAGYLERSAALAPASRAAVLLAGLRTREGRHAEAAALLAPVVEGAGFADAVAQDPGFGFEILLHYGRTLSELEHFTDAVPPLRRAAELRPGHAETWHLLGTALVETGEVDAARQALARARELDEAAHEAAAQQSARREQARGLVERAARLHGERRNAEAVELLRQAVELAPDDPTPRMLEVRLLVSLDRHDEALARADELVEMQPGSPDVLHLRGMTRLSAGRVAAAEADLRRAVELAPEHREAVTGLAVVLIEQRRLVEADDLLDWVLARWPEDETARRARSRLDALLPSR
jgi:Flp pilus assembly protein TadD